MKRSSKPGNKITFQKYLLLGFLLSAKNPRINSHLHVDAPLDAGDDDLAPAARLLVLFDGGQRRDRVRASSGRVGGLWRRVERDLVQVIESAELQAQLLRRRRPVLVELQLTQFFGL